MNKLSILLPAIALCVAPVLAQDTAPTYEDTIDCATMNISMSAFSEEGSDDEKTFEDTAGKWIAYGMENFGFEGEKIIKDFDARVEKFSEEVSSIDEDDDKAIDALLEPLFTKCVTYELAYSAQLNAAYEKLGE